MFDLPKNCEANRIQLQVFALLGRVLGRCSRRCQVAYECPYAVPDFLRMRRCVLLFDMHYWISPRGFDGPQIRSGFREKLWVRLPRWRLIEERFLQFSVASPQDSFPCRIGLRINGIIEGCSERTQSRFHSAHEVKHASSVVLKRETFSRLFNIEGG